MRAVGGGRIINFVLAERRERAHVLRRLQRREGSDARDHAHRRARVGAARHLREHHRPAAAIARVRGLRRARARERRRAARAEPDGPDGRSRGRHRRRRGRFLASDDAATSRATRCSSTAAGTSTACSGIRRCRDNRRHPVHNAGHGRLRSGGRMKAVRWVTLGAVLALASALVVPAAATAQSGDEIGVTDDTIRIAVIADVDNPARPGLFQGTVEGVRAAAEYINDEGGIGGRTVEVDFIDSRLSPDEARSALIKACETDFALVGTQRALHEQRGADGLLPRCGRPGRRASPTSPTCRPRSRTSARRCPTRSCSSGSTARPRTTRTPGSRCAPGTSTTTRSASVTSTGRSCSPRT